MEDLTMIVGFPAEWHRDQTYYCGSSDPMHNFCQNDPYNPDCKSNMFANLYTPIWDGGANGTPYNDDNYLAAYMYKMVSTYKDHVKFWEIWNEPGFDHSFSQGWQQPGGPNNWWDNDPSPCVNHFHAPIEHFVRTLRICYDVVKTVDPDAYVALSGVGFESFLDAVLRNTDNPIDGSVTADYPLGGGAYFDVMGFHTYPDIDGSVRDLVNGQWVYTRNSDKAAQGVPKRKNSYEALLAQYGYDGNTHPKKEWIITEINTPRVPFYASNPNSMASDESQTNYITKAMVAAMKIDVRQMHPYQLADRKTVANATGEFDLLGMYLNFTGTDPYTNLTKTNEGIAYTTTSKLIFGTSYDATKTAAMNLPSNVDGGAFYDAVNNRYKYILWAKTTLDLSEAASATYSFPSSFGLSTINKREWNWSETNSSSDISSNNIALTGRPIYLIDGQDPGNGHLTLTCPANMNVALPQGAGNVAVTWNDPAAITTCPGSSTASVSQTAGMVSGSSFWMGTHTISYQAFDQCGNTANCSFDIIVGPSTGGSTINTMCSPDITISAVTGANSAIATWIEPTATTTCATNSNVTVSQTSGSPSGANFAIGAHNIEYTFTDQCGTTATCTFSVTVNPGATSSCDAISGFTKLGELNGKGYYVSNDEMTWNSASTLATANGGNIATISSQEENDFIANLIDDLVFIGFSDASTEGTVIWESGEALSYTNYSDCDWCGLNTADNDFGVMLPWNGEWSFNNQWVHRKFILETTCGGGTGTGCPSTIAGFTNLGDYNGHNYYLSDNSLNWDAANMEAINAGGYLATMNDQNENDFLMSNLGNNLVIIGYNDAASEGNGEWANGESVSLDLSYGNDLDNDYGVMNFWAGTWQMVNQWVAKPYVMEMNCSGSSPSPIAPHAVQITSGVQLVAIYPNPADDFITARMISGNDVEVTFTIISAQGQAKVVTIDQLTKGANEVDFEIQDLMPGMYFLKATGENVNQVIRFVKMN